MSHLHPCGALAAASETKPSKRLHPAGAWSAPTQPDSGSPLPFLSAAGRSSRVRNASGPTANALGLSSREGPPLANAYLRLG